MAYDLPRSTFSYSKKLQGEQVGRGVGEHQPRIIQQHSISGLAHKGRPGKCSKALNCSYLCNLKKTSKWQPQKHIRGYYLFKTQMTGVEVESANGYGA